MDQYVPYRFSKEEELCLIEFDKLAKSFPVMFARYRGTEYGTPFDVLSRTETGGTYAIELKMRYKLYDDMFIEFDKFTKLREIWRNKKMLPLYICFLPEEKLCYMWKLNEVLTAIPHLNKNIKVSTSDGQSYMYQGDRIGLSLDEAYVFGLEGDTYKMYGKPLQSYEITELPQYREEDILDQEITKNNYYKL